MDKRISGRTEQLNLKVSPNFRKKLKLLAAKQDCLLIEVLEQALESYQKNHKSPKKTKKSSAQVKAIPTKPKLCLIPYRYFHFVCDNCGEEYEDAVVYSVAKSWEELKTWKYKTYCSNCIN